jgi:hypothetical protein
MYEPVFLLFCYRLLYCHRSAASITCHRKLQEHEARCTRHMQQVTKYNCRTGSAKSAGMHVQNPACYDHLTCGKTVGTPATPSCTWTVATASCIKQTFGNTQGTAAAAAASAASMLAGGPVLPQQDL